MRPILLYFIVFFSLTRSYGQQIELLGSYEAYPTGETVYFFGKDSFYYRDYWCSYANFGKGRCVVGSDYLYLYFQQENKGSLRSPVITKTEKADSFSIVRITCIDYNDNPLQNVMALIEGTHFGTVTKASGEGILKVKNTGNPITIRISSMDMELQQLKIDPSYNYTIKIFLRPGSYSRELHDGQVYIYEISELSNDLIIMRREGSKDNFMEFKKRQ